MGSNSSLHVSAEIRVNDRLHSAAKPQSQSGVTRRANFVANGDKERGLIREFFFARRSPGVRSAFGVHALTFLDAGFVSIEAIYKTGQHRHHRSKHLFAGANPIGRDEALCD